MQSTDTAGHFNKLGFSCITDADRDVVQLLLRHFRAERPGGGFDLEYEVIAQPSIESTGVAKPPS